MQMSASEIAHSYRRNGQSREQINILAELNACSPAAIVEVLKQEGVALPPGSNSHQCRPLPQAPYHIDELRAMELYREGLCDMDMAEQLGCTRSSVANWRKRMHLKAHYPQRQARKPGQTAPPVPPEEETPPDAVRDAGGPPLRFPRHGRRGRRRLRAAIDADRRLNAGQHPAHHGRHRSKHDSFCGWFSGGADGDHFRQGPAAHAAIDHRQGAQTCLIK